MAGRWRLAAIWTALLVLSVIARSYSEVVDEAKRGHPVGWGHALGVETTSHLVVAALLPVLYWLHRRWPMAGSLRSSRKVATDSTLVLRRLSGLKSNCSQ